MSFRALLINSMHMCAVIVITAETRNQPTNSVLSVITPIPVYLPLIKVYFSRKKEHSLTVSLIFFP